MPEGASRKTVACTGGILAVGVASAEWTDSPAASTAGTTREPRYPAASHPAFRADRSEVRRMASATREELTRMVGREQPYMQPRTEGAQGAPESATTPP